MNPIKSQFLKAGNLDDVVQLFINLGFHKSQGDDDFVDIEINDDTDFISLYVKNDDTQTIDSIAGRYVSGRKAVLEISGDFKEWVFARIGIEEKQRVLKYRISQSKVKKEENPIAIQRLASLKYNDDTSWDDLFDRKDISKKFYQEFKKKRFSIMNRIEGIPDEKNEDKSWYATILLNRIIFLYFLQQKGVLDKNERYLNEKFQEFEKKRKPFFAGFLKVLFFDTLCKEKEDRAPETSKITGNNVPYLNGGLFLKHELEDRYPHLDIPNRAFQDLFIFFESWFWNPSEREIGEGDQIDPYILGYIFEKSLGETKGESKSGGVYYTPPSLAIFLTRETILSHLANQISWFGVAPKKQDVLDTISSLSEEKLKELFQVLASLKILDPASGSGQFLVEALHELTEFYEALLKAGTTGKFPDLISLINQKLPLTGDQKSDLYAIRRYIVSENLYGVDLLNEAVEITKLRLFLGMIEDIENDIKEPLPNIDFNIRRGNSLVGFLHLPDFEKHTSMTKSLLAENLRKRYDLIQKYRHTKNPEEALVLRKKIKEEEVSIQVKLDAHFERKAGYEWKIKPKKKIDFIDLKNESKESLGLQRDIQHYKFKAQENHALHWELIFWGVMHGDGGGFDIVLGNPPWETWKPNSQEFFENHIKDFRKLNKTEAKQKVENLFKDPKNQKIKDEWISHNLRVSAVASYFSSSGMYPNRGSGDIALQKLFLERCFYLLNKRGTQGCVVPSGLYSDKGSTELRKMFFEKSNVHFIYGFENRKALFEGVHRSFKFILFSASRSNTPSPGIPSAFMMHTEDELLKAHAREKNSRFVDIPVSLLPKVSGEILALMEFKSQQQVELVQKIYANHPVLAEELEGVWNISLKSEFHMTNDSHLFIEKEQLKEMGCAFDPKTMSWKDKKGEKYLPLYEGKMIWQYDAYYEKPRYWLKEIDTRKVLLGKKKDTGQILPYQQPRLCYRDVASNTNQRTWIMARVPWNVYMGNSLSYVIPSESFNELASFAFLGIANSFVMDFILRLKITSNINIFYTKSLPIIRESKNPLFTQMADKVFSLLSSPKKKTQAIQTLKNQIDAMVAHLYALKKEELSHILSTFPLVENDIKEGALKEFQKLS